MDNFSASIKGRFHCMSILSIVKYTDCFSILSVTAVETVVHMEHNIGGVLLKAGPGKRKAKDNEASGHGVHLFMPSI